MHQKTVAPLQAGRCWWIFSHVYLVKVIVALVYSFVGQDQLGDAEGWRLRHVCEAKVACLRPSGLSGQSEGVG